MGIFKGHVPIYREVFAIPGVLAEPLLSLGHQVMLGRDLPPDFDFADLNELLKARGLRDVTVLDLFDERADLRHDLNLPVPPSEHERYASVFDIGTLEHLFDARQCLESCMRMVRPGGHFFLVTVVKGWFLHGYHVFHPAFVRQAFELNGFEGRFLRYTAKDGAALERPGDADDVLIWIVGRKTAPIGEFAVPQQKLWSEYYT
jgi:SAM-dependent methyltransferase